MSTHQTSLLKIIFTDYVTFVCTLFSVVFVLFGPAVMIIWFLTIPVIVSRIRLIKRIFSQGELSKSTITKRWFFKHGARIRYSFSIQGEQYNVGNYVRRSTLPYQVGDQVEVLYLKDKPCKAIITDLYRKK